MKWIFLCGMSFCLDVVNVRKCTFRWHHSEKPIVTVGCFCRQHLFAWFHSAAIRIGKKACQETKEIGAERIPDTWHRDLQWWTTNTSSSWSSQLQKYGKFVSYLWKDLCKSYCWNDINILQCFISSKELSLCLKKN